MSTLKKAGGANLDINIKRKVDSRLKYFTTQISEIPGPQKDIIKKVG